MPDILTTAGVFMTRSASGWQLSSGQFPPSRMAFQWINPNGNEGTRSAYLVKHSQFNYERAFTVGGGSPPYHFELVSPVTGVSVAKRAPSWNPYFYLWCDVTIDGTFTSGNSFTVRAWDQNLTSIDVTVTVTVDDNRFVFVEDGATGGDGSFASPFEDTNDWYNSNDADTTHQNDIVVYRAGTYLIDNYDTGNSAMQMNANKPSGWIAFPGETVNFTMDSNIAFTDGTDDWYFGRITYNGGDSTAGNSRTFAFVSAQSRIVQDRPRSINPVRGTAGNDNPAFLYGSGVGEDGRSNISLVDFYAEGYPPTPGQGVSVINTFDTNDSVVAGGTIRNCNGINIVWCKHGNKRFMYAGIDAYDLAGQDPARLFQPQQADAGLYTTLASDGVQYVGCKGYKAADGGPGDDVCETGDSNQLWNTVYWDRMTVVGRTGFEGGSANTNGDVYMEDSIVINDQTPTIDVDYVTTDNATDTRANLSNYLLSNGDVDPLGSARYGEQGATFIEP